MQTVWFPLPVVALFRRLVNVVSTLSISHHYLSQTPRTDSDTRAAPSLSPQSLSSSKETSQYRNRTNGLPDYVYHARETTEVNDPPPRHTSSSWSSDCDNIHSLINNPALYDPIRPPRYPIVLCHGLYGFDVRGPSAFPVLQHHYWSNVLGILRKKVGAEVLVTGVPSTGSVSSRAENLHRFLCEKAASRGVNFLAHSMGGLDCRHLISHIKPTDYVPLSLTTIATPHRGSPFMDWCKQYLGLGRYTVDHPRVRAMNITCDPSDNVKESTAFKEQQTETTKSLLSSLPSSFTTLLLSLLDSPAYAHLTTTYLDTFFNPNTPDEPSVKYFSVAGRTSSMNIWHPLWLPKMVLDGFEERERARLRELGHPFAEMDSEWGNDGLVTIQSARWGEFLGVLEGCDHWELRGARGLDVDLPLIPGADAWNFADWSKFVRAWKREEKEAAKSAGAGISEQKHGALATAGADFAESERGDRDPRQPRDRESMNADAVVKSSTDKLSAVFDWIVDQVPASRFSASGAKSDSEGKGDEKDRPRSTKRTERNDLATKMDLERFYVALCRKLYDEGL